MSKKSKNSVFLFVGRDDWQKDTGLNHVLVNYSKKKKYKIVWEDPAGGFTYKLRLIESHFKNIPSIIKKLNLRLSQILYALTHWSYFIYLYEQIFNRKEEDFVKLRCKRLKKRIQELSIENEVVIISRSSGGRVSSLIADELKIKHIICLGYPFQNPDNGVEPERYLHLEHLKTPMLIIQGIDDEYGGSEIKEKYKFSSNIGLYFVDADHSFNVDANTWNEIYHQIDKVIQ